MDPVIKYCVAVAVVDAVVLVAYHTNDPYKNVERFYFNRSKVEYGILKMGYFVVFMTFMISIKMIAGRVLFGR